MSNRESNCGFCEENSLIYCIDDTVRTAKRIHTVLDSILNFIEVPEVDDSALDKESSTEKPDTKLLVNFCWALCIDA